jgi:hypothetical protein
MAEIEDRDREKFGERSGERKNSLRIFSALLTSLLIFVVSNYTKIHIIKKLNKA